MLSRLPITLAQLKAGNNFEKLKNEIRQLLHSLYHSKEIDQNNLQPFDQNFLKMETIFMNTKSSKTNERHRFRLSLVDKFNLKDPNKIMALANLSIYYTWKNIKLAYNNNKFKIYAPDCIMNLVCLMDLNLLQTSKTTLNLPSKNTKL